MDNLLENIFPDLTIYIVNSTPYRIRYQQHQWVLQSLLTILGLWSLIYRPSQRSPFGPSLCLVLFCVFATDFTVSLEWRVVFTHWVVFSFRVVKNIIWIFSIYHLIWFGFHGNCRASNNPMVMDGKWLTDFHTPNLEMLSQRKRTSI